jgi:hypothetical protein
MNETHIGAAMRSLEAPGGTLVLVLVPQIDGNSGGGSHFSLCYDATPSNSMAREIPEVCGQHQMMEYTQGGRCQGVVLGF